MALTNSTIDVVVQGDPGVMIPKRVNMFLINTTAEGTFLDCIWNSKQIDANNNMAAFLATRLAVTPDDLRTLRKAIDDHLAAEAFQNEA